ncbi:MAG: hypothetical protein JWQ72_163 [Polaromonas sp.]|nr:hypothetical protein [Polaromonas sp.]
MRRLTSCRLLGAGLLAALAIASASAAVAADEAGNAEGADKAAPPVAFKLTTGLYQLRGGGQPSAQALDINLRASSIFGNVWLGQFRSPSQAITQTRLGWDRTFAWDAVRFVPSLEVATGGYVGASGYVEAGNTWFVGAGLSRTNLQNFINLNFDPGDAYTLATGYRWGDNDSLALQLVRDNRLNPDQQNVHLIYRTPLEGGRRLTLDALYKTGLVSGSAVRKAGLSVAYDWPRFFVRVVYDPLSNFTPQDMLRVSVGTRF